jgi:hypothetical protein
MRMVAGRVAFGPEFAGKTKMVKVYNLSGGLVYSASVLENSVDLQADFGLPIGLYVVNAKVAR